jgi:hypothetical protein
MAQTGQNQISYILYDIELSTHSIIQPALPPGRREPQTAKTDLFRSRSLFFYGGRLPTEIKTGSCRG